VRSIIMHTKTIEVVLTIVLLPSELSDKQLLQDVTTVTTVTGFHTCLNTVSTPVFLSQHLVSQHLFWCLNTCHLRQICVSTLIRKPCIRVPPVELSMRGFTSVAFLLPQFHLHITS